MQFSYLIIFIIIIYLQFQLTIANGSQIPRHSCGPNLDKRVQDLCKSRGGSNQMKPHRRRRRNIVNECCKQICSDSQVHKYCLYGEPIVILDTSNRYNIYTIPNAVAEAQTMPLQQQQISFEVGTVEPEFLLKPFRYPRSKMILRR